MTNFSVFEDGDESHEKIFMRRESGEIFTDAQELNIIDLTKAEKDKEKNLWVQLFKVTTLEELDMVAGESEEMAEAAEKLLLLSEDECARAYVDSLDHAELGRRMREQEKFDEGVEVGVEQGIEKEKYATAMKLLTKGMSTCDVVEITGLSASEVEKLKT